MRKRSKYRPKPIMVNTMEYAMESVKPLRTHDTYVQDWKLQVHTALYDIIRGQASRREFNTMLATHNICEALVAKMKIGKDYVSILKDAHQAFVDVTNRAAVTGSHTVKSHEMTAFNDLGELHDALMDHITVQQMEQAYHIARRCLDNATRLKPMKEAA